LTSIRVTCGQTYILGYNPERVTYLLTGKELDRRDPHDSVCCSSAPEWRRCGFDLRWWGDFTAR